MKNILVTGGAGFLGSHLCEKLLLQGHRVTCLDNFFTGKESNIAHLRKHASFSFIEHDVTQIPSEKFPQAFTEIYNLACPASPLHYKIDPIYTTQTCVYGAINFLELAKAHKAKILQASTSEVYGDPLVHPQPETYHGNVNAIGIRSCYDEGKRCAETLFFDYYRHHQIQIKIVRIFNTYGPRMSLDDGRVVSNFIIQALEGQDITISGDGSQTRSFCYVDDLIPAMINMMNTTDDVVGPINIGNPTEITMLELAQSVIKLTESNSKLIYLPLPEDDPKQRRPDITLAKKVLAWQPQTNLIDGLTKTNAYFKGIL